MKTSLTAAIALVITAISMGQTSGPWVRPQLGGKAPVGNTKSATSKSPVSKEASKTNVVQSKPNAKAPVKSAAQPKVAAAKGKSSLPAMSGSKVAPKVATQAKVPVTASKASTPKKAGSKSPGLAKGIVSSTKKSSSTPTAPPAAAEKSFEFPRTVTTPAATTAPATQPAVVPASQTPAESPAKTTALPVTQSTTTAPVETTPSAPRQARIKTISNVFADTDIKTVVQEMANASGAQIIADTSVKGIEINIEFKKDTIESALEKLSFATGILWKKKGELYLVSMCTPESPLFGEFAETKVYTPHTQPAENLFSLLTRNFLTYAQLDKAANMISVTAPPRQMDAIWKSLSAADAPRKQFVVEAMVTQLDDQAIKSAGFSWDWHYFAQGSDLSMTYATATKKDLITMKALISNNRAELRANPKVVASEGHEASITVGNESYFAMDTGNAAYASIQYQRINTGITLKFTGFIEPDGMVNLHLQPEISDAVTLVNGNPQTTMRKADTYVRIKFGETVALGGMVIQNTTIHNQKIPVLGDIPVLGNVFRSSSKDKNKTEVVILITPRLVS